MKEAAIQYYREGYNCSQCLIKAAERCYGTPVSNKMTSMCEGLSNGFGIGGICSCLVAGVMIFGMLFDRDSVKRMRIQFLDQFNTSYRSLMCKSLISESGNNDCEKLIGEIADMIAQIINRENEK